MVVGGAALVVLAVAAWFGLQSLRDREHLVADGPPAFNFVYAPSALHEVSPRDGELARVAGRRRNVSISISVRRVELPPYGNGDVVGGYLPLLAEERLDELREQYGPLQVFDEGKARINRFPGYQIGFGAQTAGGRLFGRDAYVLPEDPEATEGVLLSMRRVVRRRQRPADEELFDKAKEAFTSFAFGKSQP